VADLPSQTLGAGSETDPAAVRALVDEVSGYGIRRAAWEVTRAETVGLLNTLDDFRGLGLSPSRIASLDRLQLLVGTLPEGAGPALSEALGPLASARPLVRPGRWALLVRPEDRSRWEPLLEAHRFHPLPLPAAEVLGDPDTSLDRRIAGLEDRLAALDGEGRDLDADRSALAQARTADLHRLLAAAAVDQQVDQAAAGQATTAALALVEGWVPAPQVPGLAQDLGELTGGRVSVSVRDPGPGDRPPTQLRPRWGTAGFEKMVANFGAPAYGAIDPTPFVAWSYILLFAVMFGDLGQGACIVVAGLLLARGLPGFGGFRATAPAFVKVGLASMAAGLVYGSVFSYEHLLPGLVRLVPIDNVGRLLVFFAFTLALGVVLNSLGLVLHLIDSLRARKWEEAFLGKTGLAGALVFWYGLTFAVRLGLGGRPGPWDFFGFGLPLAALLVGPSVVRAFRGQTPFEDGAGLFVASLFLDTFETLAFYLSNTLSFLRVGAFALSHAVLSLIVFTLADLVSQAFAGGWAFGLVIVLVGNALIVGLEGLIVAIQVLRLEYYEFFAKFFFETGTFFRPFQFVYQGDQP
jgi:V/A-type H+-transporting ATPase subunit I